MLQDGATDTECAHLGRRVQSSTMQLIHSCHVGARPQQQRDTLPRPCATIMNVSCKACTNFGLMLQLSTARVAAAITATDIKHLPWLCASKQLSGGS